MKIMKADCKIMIDGIGAINKLGLYQICKNRKDADFIYRLLIKNSLKPGEAKSYVFLDGYELIKNKRNLFKLGVPINDKYDLITLIASKVNKGIETPHLSLKFTGLFLYRNISSNKKVLVPSEQSYVNGKKIDYYFQYEFEFCLDNNYLEEDVFSGKILPQSTQFFNTNNLIDDKDNDNHLYFFEGDVVKIVKQYFSPEDQSNFIKIQSDRIFEKGKEVKIEKINTVVIDEKPFSTVMDNIEVAANDSIINLKPDSPKSNAQIDEDEILETTENNFLTTQRAEHFRVTVFSFFDFILSLPETNLNNGIDIYLLLKGKYKKSHWCEDVESFMALNQHNKSVGTNNSYLFIAALFALIKGFEIKLFENNSQIYAKYERYRKEGSWTPKTLQRDIGKSTKELKLYLKK